MLLKFSVIIQVLVRLVGADDHVYPNFMDVMQWLANSDLLEMVVDKLNPYVSKKIAAVIFCNFLLYSGLIFWVRKKNHGKCGLNSGFEN